MEFTSKNPYNGEVLGTYGSLSAEALEEKLQLSDHAFNNWRKTPLDLRCKLIAQAGKILRDKSEECARMITQEMGKPIREARAEVEKCVWVCDYYAENASEFLAKKNIETDASKSFVRYDPIGTVFAVMPWNFPFWQVFRFAAPTLTAGNTAVLKHAPNVFGCASMIEDIFREAGYPSGVFQNLIVHHDESEKIIGHPAVKAVTLTGSERAGSSVAALAGKYLKKTVLELGGSNAFVVLEDANLDSVIQTAVNARMMNTGQSCIAAKRFIVVKEVYGEFEKRLTSTIGKLKPGNPLEEDTQVGVLARKDLSDNLQRQIRESVEMGAEILLGGKQNGCCHEPTVLNNVTPEMPAFKEETFGPLAALIKAENEEEAMTLAGNTTYGLGMTICTENTEKALQLAEDVADGACFINELVKSDPRMPFGGTKKSGYGRELAQDGILEFVNRKAIWVK